MHTQTSDASIATTLSPEPDLPEHSADIRVGRELFNATLPFVEESIARSWWYVGSTFSLMIGDLIGAGIAPWWPVRTALSVLGALLMVRAFITYHDYMHGAILPIRSWPGCCFACMRPSHLPRHVHGKRVTIIITATWARSARKLSVPSR